MLKGFVCLTGPMLFQMFHAKFVLVLIETEMKHAKCHANKTKIPRSDSNQHAHLFGHLYYIFRQSREEGKLTVSLIIYWHITEQTFVLNLMSAKSTESI